MNGLKFIASNSEGICFGFITLADAEAFLRGQSRNPGWLSQWTLRLESIYGETVATVSTSKPISLTFET